MRACLRLLSPGHLKVLFGLQSVKSSPSLLYLERSERGGRSFGRASVAAEVCSRRFPTRGDFPTGARAHGATRLRTTARLLAALRSATTRRRLPPSFRRTAAAATVAINRGAYPWLAAHFFLPKSFFCTAEERRFGPEWQSLERSFPHVLTERRLRDDSRRGDHSDSWDFAFHLTVTVVLFTARDTGRVTRLPLPARAALERGSLRRSGDRLESASTL